MQGDALLNFVEQTYVDIQHEVTDDPIEWKLRTGKYNQTKRTSIANGALYLRFLFLKLVSKTPKQVFF